METITYYIIMCFDLVHLLVHPSIIGDTLRKILQFTIGLYGISVTIFYTLETFFGTLIFFQTTLILLSFSNPL